jgi:hypothetical protein
MAFHAGIIDYGCAWQAKKQLAPCNLANQNDNSMSGFGLLVDRVLSGILIRSVQDGFR